MLDEEKVLYQFIFNFFSFRLAHHEAMQMRRTQIRGSDSDSDENARDDDEFGVDDETDDIEWGPATEL